MDAYGSWKDLGYLFYVRWLIIINKVFVKVIRDFFSFS